MRARGTSGLPTLHASSAIPPRRPISPIQGVLVVVPDLLVHISRHAAYVRLRSELTYLLVNCRAGQERRSTTTPHYPGGHGGRSAKPRQQQPGTPLPRARHQ
jgi:hypothetical protein